MFTVIFDLHYLVVSPTFKGKKLSQEGFSHRFKIISWNTDDQQIKQLEKR